MVAVVQLVEHQVVILAVAGSSPVSHPAGGRGFLTLPPSAFLGTLHPYRNLATTCGTPSLPSVALGIRRSVAAPAICQYAQFASANEWMHSTRGGHRTASGAAICPSVSIPFGLTPVLFPARPPTACLFPAARPRPNERRFQRSGGRVRPRWSPGSSSVTYTPHQVQALAPVRREIVARAASPDHRDVFLCHAWDDRLGAAKELHDLLEAIHLSVWFSEKDVLLGVPLLRAIDKGLANSRAGIVMVTPFVPDSRRAGEHR